ncbi:MAG: multidrug effflux MFS transporter [Nitriliruptorales bacterium]|nr:multidrug effflux MFS transporter [Nitriliruptorales bacterium]
MSMALAALGIDLMLPAFPDLRQAFDLPADSTAVAGAVTAYFLGLAGGQLVYGPLADRFGRRPALYLGYGIYAVGALASALSPSLAVLYAARLIWGLGAAGCRVITFAVIRDRYEGERMSRAMSFVMAVFVLVPIAAPAVGAVITAVGGWQWVFLACVVAVVGIATWAVRLPETLHEEYRLELRFGRILAATRQVVSHRQSMAYTLAMTALYGVFTSYLASSEIIFGQAFGAADTFPYLFGGLAAVMGGAMLLNARIVGTFGTRRLSHVVLVGYLVAAAALLALALATGGRPPLWAFLLAMAVLLSGHALLIPNFNTIAMDPMAAIAGTASSVIGAVQLAGGALLGAVLDRAFDGTILPLAWGFVLYGILALALVLWGEDGGLFEPLRGSPQPATASSARTGRS